MKQTVSSSRVFPALFARRLNPSFPSGAGRSSHTRCADRADVSCARCPLTAAQPLRAFVLAAPPRAPPRSAHCAQLVAAGAAGPAVPFRGKQSKQSADSRSYLRAIFGLAVCAGRGPSGGAVRSAGSFRSQASPAHFSHQIGH